MGVPHKLIATYISSSTNEGIFRSMVRSIFYIDVQNKPYTEKWLMPPVLINIRIQSDQV